MIESTITDDSFTVAWDKVEYASDYVILILPGDGRAIETPGNFATFDGLDPGTPYRVSIRSRRNEQTSISACVVDVTTALGPPPPPVTNLHLTQPAAIGNVTMAWDSPAGSYDGYLIYRTVEGGSRELYANIERTDLTFTDTDVKCGRGYTYDVVTYRADPPQQSDAEQLIVAISPVQAVTNLVQTHPAGEASGSVNLGWSFDTSTDPPPQWSGFYVERRALGEADFTRLATLGTDARAFADVAGAGSWDAPVPGNLYTYRLITYLTQLPPPACESAEVQVETVATGGQTFTPTVLGSKVDNRTAQWAVTDTGGGSWQITYGDDTGADGYTGDKTVSHTFAVDGTYTVRILVGGREVYQIKVTAPIPAVPAFTLSATDPAEYRKASATGNNANQNGPHSINWGDGVTDTGVPFEATDIYTHTYEADGTHTVTAWAESDPIAWAAKSVTIAPPA